MKALNGAAKPVRQERPQKAFFICKILIAGLAATLAISETLSAAFALFLLRRVTREKR